MPKTLLSRALRTICFRVVGLQAVRPDAHVVRPILAGREFLGEAEHSNQEQDAKRQQKAKAGSDTQPSRTQDDVSFNRLQILGVFAFLAEFLCVLCG